MDASYKELKKKLEEVHREINGVVKLCKIYEDILLGIDSVETFNILCIIKIFNSFIHEFNVFIVVH